MRLCLAFCLGLAGAAANAEPPLTAEAFDALTQGRSMTWSEFGLVYGVEQYLPGRRVRWTYLGDTCIEGRWYADGSAICFDYEDRPEPICWEMTVTPTGLGATLVGVPGQTAEVVIEKTTEPMACFGPKVGV